MPYRMVSADGDLSFELRSGVPLVLGRALSSDLPVLDPTVSRRHAELQVEGESVSLRDLGSSNGTFVNGIGIPRDQTMRLTPGDRIVFGRVLFELRELSPVLVDDASAAGIRRAARAGTTIIRQVPVPDAEQALDGLRGSGAQRSSEKRLCCPPYLARSAAADVLPSLQAPRGRGRGLCYGRSWRLFRMVTDRPRCYS